MVVDLKEYYCERIGKEFLVDIGRKGAGVQCEYYHAGRNPYSMRFNRLCSIDFPENKKCLLEKLRVKERVRNKTIS